MKRLVLYLALVFTAASVMAACSQPAASAPTSAPTKAAEPTKAAAPAPTAPAKAAEPTKASEPTKAASPASSTTFPEKGRSITIINPFAAGGGSDLACRILASIVEKDLGVSVQVVAKPGAGTQVGLTEIAKAKPDGYTVGYVVLPDGLTTYLNPDRKAVYNRSAFEPVCLHAFDPLVFAVKPDSPYKSMSEVLEAAKKNPNQVKTATFGALSPIHLALIEMEKLTGAKLAMVHFDGAAPSLNALLGGHVDVAAAYVGGFAPAVKSGQVRGIAILDREENKFIPGAKTLEAQGFKQYVYKASSLCVPAGTPKEVVSVLNNAFKKAMETDEHKKKMEEIGQTLRYMSAAEFGDYWIQEEKRFQPLLEEALQAEKK